MNPRATLLILPLAASLVGCSHDDARLQGTWKSNREETMTALFKADPNWAAAAPERKEQFGRLFGNMTITYSNRVATMVTPATTMGTTALPASTNTMHYKVVERGPTHVVIQSQNEPSLMAKDGKTRIDFTPDAKGYWIQMGFLMAGQKEKFDRVSP